MATIRIETDHVTSASDELTALADEVAHIAGGVVGISADSSAIAGTSAGLADLATRWGTTVERMTGGLARLGVVAAAAASRAGQADRTG